MFSKLIDCKILNNKKPIILFKEQRINNTVLVGLDVNFDIAKIYTLENNKLIEKPYNTKPLGKGKSGLYYNLGEVTYIIEIAKGVKGLSYKLYIPRGVKDKSTPSNEKNLLKKFNTATKYQLYLSKVYKTNLKADRLCILESNIEFIYNSRLNKKIGGSV